MSETPEMYIRAAKAKLAAGGHIAAPEPRDKYAAEMLRDSLGTITNPEIDSLYAERMGFWETLTALPGVALTDHGCAYMPDHATADNGPELHAAADPADYVPDTVEELLSSAGQAPPEIVFQMAIFRTGESDDGRAYESALEISPDMPTGELATMLRAAADAIENMPENE